MTDLPDEAVDEAERLTRLARRATDEAEAAAYRRERDSLLADHDYTGRVRSDADGDVLVCYPAEWVEDGVVVPDRIDDVDRGVERPLSGPGDDAAWNEVSERNDALVAQVAEDHGETHAANARSLADFAGNHYAKPIPELTPAECREFLDEYFPRNAWPTEAQRELVEESVRVIFEKTDRDSPLEE